MLRGDSSLQSEVHRTVNSASITPPVTRVMDYRHLRARRLAEEMQEADRAQSELVARASQSRQKVLGQLADEDARLFADIAAVQKQRDTDRMSLVSALLNAEDSAADLIRTLLARNDTIKHSEPEEDVNILHLQMHTDDSFRLRRKEILSSMEQMLQVTDQAFQGHVAQRQSDQNRVLHSPDWLDSTVLNQALTERLRKQQQLASEIALEEDAQKLAFAQLQSQQDVQAQRLRRDIGLIEKELCLLTMAEQDRKSKQAELNLHCLNARRKELVELLRQLNDEQDKRQKELRKRMDELEQRREDDQMDYWLIQYQRLLDKKPIKLQATLPQEVREILLATGAMEFEPNFIRHKVTSEVLERLTDEDLRKIGIQSSLLRRSILNGIEENKASRKLSDMKLIDASESIRKEVAPSAPPIEDMNQGDGSLPVPSAPPEASITARVENECCICQDAKSLIIFLPCGHVCTCNGCSEKLSRCPLCRSNVTQRIELQY